jgi:nudix-type nucleoside diphosphatase (YffH/AdpP family)
MRSVVVHGKKLVYDGFFKLEETEFSHERLDGRMSQKLRWLSLERGDSVAAIIYNRDNQKVLLANQFKYPTFEKGPGWLLEAVAGIINPGESSESALKREVLEEIGYEIQTYEQISTFYVSPGSSSERIHLYYVLVSDENRIGAPGGLEVEGEDIELVERSLDELADMLRTNTIQDAKTIVGLQWLLNKTRSDNRS